MLLNKLEKIFDQLNENSIDPDRKNVLQELINYIQQKIDATLDINLHFICTHNSRRSQFTQLWALTAAFANDIKISSFSGGVEVTAFHPNAVNALKRAGFETEVEGKNNPKYVFSYSENEKPLVMYSKLYNDKNNPSKNFAAIMTCSHADETCPIIIGAEKRISITYEDPKAFDGTKLEAKKYDERCIQIATEMKYVFSQIKTPKE